MLINGWIIIQAKKTYGWSGRITKVTSKKPSSVPVNAIALKLNIELPNSIFEDSQFYAKIVVTEDQTKGVVIDAKTEENISQILTEQLGVNVHITSEVMDDDSQ